MDYKAATRRKEKIQGNQELISESELSSKWGISVHGVRLETQRLKIKIREKAGKEYYYLRHECNSKMPFLRGDNIEKRPAHNSSDIMTKKMTLEERKALLERCLKDPNLVQRKELMSIWGCSYVKVNTILSAMKIRSKYRIADELNKPHSFYLLSECQKSFFKYKDNSEYENAINDKSLITTMELSRLWGTTQQSAVNILAAKRIKSIKKISDKSRKHRDILSFYSRAECEAARPFINEEPVINNAYGDDNLSSYDSLTDEEVK